MPGRGRPVHPPLAPGRRRGRHPPPLRRDGASSPLGCWGGPGGEPGSAGARAGPPQPPASRPTWPQCPHNQHPAFSPRRPPALSPHGAARCGRGSAAILGRSRAEPSRARSGLPGTRMYPARTRHAVPVPSTPNHTTPHLLFWGAATHTLAIALGAPATATGAQPPSLLVAPGPRATSPTPASPSAFPSPSLHQPSLSLGTRTPCPAPVPVHTGLQALSPGTPQLGPMGTVPGATRERGTCSPHPAPHADGFCPAAPQRVPAAHSRHSHCHHPAPRSLTPRSPRQPPRYRWDGAGPWCHRAQGRDQARSGARGRSTAGPVGRCSEPDPGAAPARSYREPERDHGGAAPTEPLSACPDGGCFPRRQEPGPGHGGAERGGGSGGWRARTPHCGNRRTARPPANGDRYSRAARPRSAPAPAPRRRSHRSRRSRRSRR